MAKKEDYTGREQALLKHNILETYLERLFLIIGLSGELTINYVDCFAGPWCEEDEQLKDTSIGRSIDKIKKCAYTLEKNYNKKVKFRALYIEKDKKAYKKLEAYLSSIKVPFLETHSIPGDYTQHIQEIADWTKGHFTFFFIDPKGWKGIIGPETLKPLLSLPKTEFLINLMYDFANRAASIDKHKEDIEALVGEQLIFTGDESPGERQELFLSTYQKNVKTKFQLGKKDKSRSTYIPINRPGTEKLLYFLVYFTSHPKGIQVFKDEAEKMMGIQRVTEKEVKLKKQQEKTVNFDLFGSELDTSHTGVLEQNNKYLARIYILEALKDCPMLIDLKLWADLLEKSNLYPTDFQLAMKELVKEGVVTNLNSDISKRRTRFIRPDWPNKSEVWALIEHIPQTSSN